MHIFLHKLQSCATSCTDLLCLTPRGRRSTLSLAIAPTSWTQNESGWPLFLELPGGHGWLRLSSKVTICRESLCSSHRKTITNGRTKVSEVCTYSKHLGANMSCISKPWSAMTLSPGCSSARIPLPPVIRRSEIRPPHNSETNATTPPGLMPIKTLKVLWCFYEEKVNSWLCSDEGRWIDISVQSIITLVLGYLWNCESNRARMASWLSHGNSNLNSLYSTLLNSREKVATDMQTFLQCLQTANLIAVSLVLQEIHPQARSPWSGMGSASKRLSDFRFRYARRAIRTW